MLASFHFLDSILPGILELHKYRVSTYKTIKIIYIYIYIYITKGRN
jgi:hypothetical protein